MIVYASLGRPARSAVTCLALCGKASNRFSFLAIRTLAYDIDLALLDSIVATPLPPRVQKLQPTGNRLDLLVIVILLVFR